MKHPTLASCQQQNLLCSKYRIITIISIIIIIVVVVRQLPVPAVRRPSTGVRPLSLSASLSPFLSRLVEAGVRLPRDLALKSTPNLESQAV